jgi:hypothetical protein
VLTLDEIRTRLVGLNESEVSYRTGLHVNTIRRYRAGLVTDPPLDTLRRLSDYLTGRRRPA